MDMSYLEIVKSLRPSTVSPHLDDYQRICDRFSWDAVRDTFEGLPIGRGINIAHEAVDRHARTRERDRTAIRWPGADGKKLDISYLELQSQSNRFANVLKKLGVRQGEAVFSLLGRVPLLNAVVFGTFKYQPSCYLVKKYGDFIVRGHTVQLFFCKISASPCLDNSSLSIEH